MIKNAFYSYEMVDNKLQPRQFKDLIYCPKGLVNQAAPIQQPEGCSQGVSP